MASVFSFSTLSKGASKPLVLTGTASLAYLVEVSTLLDGRASASSDSLAHALLPGYHELNSFLEPGSSALHFLLWK